MKYYHIIYNSSERPMDGGVGFGIRTATIGTPAGLLTAIKNIKFFTDDWESYENKPTPAQMKDNPASIEAIAKNYAITHIADEQGKIYYIIARRAYVGFDYGFYKNGMPTRPGNYVIDYYAFEDTPDISVYQILYENASEGSNHFIPASVRPTSDNEEMTAISVGASQPLPVEDKPFNALTADALDKDVVKLFFAYLQSKKKGRKLVVRANKDKSLRLVADFYRMLSSESAKDVSIYVNLRSQGTNDNFDIFFIHEDYPHQIYDGLYDYIELESASMPETDEAKTFAKDLEGYVTSCFDRNKADIDDTLRWLMLPEYDTVKKMSKPTIDAFFLYCIQPDNFVYDTMKDAAGVLNKELLGVLASYTKNCQANAARFNLIVGEYMNDATPDNVIKRISEYNTFCKHGFSVDSITAEVKENVCTQMLSSPELLRSAIETLSFEGIEKFFVKGIFETYRNYVDSSVLDLYVLRLYKWFLPAEALAKKKEMLYVHFLKRDMDTKLFCGILDDVYDTDNDEKISFFVQVLKQNLKPFKTIWENIQIYLPKANRIPDFIEVFSDRLSNTEYAPMLYYAIKSKKDELNTVEKTERLTAILSANSALKLLIEKGYANDGIYSGFFTAVDSISTTEPSKALNAIYNNVLKFLNIKDNRLEDLVTYLRISLGESVEISFAKLASLYKIVVDKNDSSAYHKFFEKFKKLVEHKYVEPSDFVKDYYKFNSQSHCKDMLAAIVSSNQQVEIIGAIVKGFCNKPFAEAMAIAKQLDMDDVTLKRFMTAYYKKEYVAYMKKERFKEFFRSITNIFAKKKPSAHNSAKKADDADSSPSQKQ